MSKGTKEFVIDGNEFASVCHFQTPRGPLIIDIHMQTFTVKDAKRFVKWLQAAIVEVETDEKEKKIKLCKKGKKMEIVIS